MPTFSAIALDRLLEPGASKSLSSAAAAKKNGVPDPSTRLERRNTTPLPEDDVKSATKRLDIPPPHPQLRRRNTVSFTVAPEKKVPSRPQISPALYTTPESTPLPDSPTSSTSSFPPSSPYIINHKRRGPRLLKSYSEQNVAAAAAAEKKDGGFDEAESKVGNGHSRSLSVENVPCERKEGFEEERVNGHFLRDGDVEINGHVGTRDVQINGYNGDGVAQEGESSRLNGDVIAQEIEINGSNGLGESGELKVVVGSSSERDGGETEDFFDPQESMSFSSNNDGDDYSADRSAKANTPMGEFFDAWEELSSDSGRQGQRSLSDYEIELREMRLTLLMEIEKRKQAEEALHSMRKQLQILREKLGTVGLILPADLSASPEDNQSDVDPTEDICRQIQLARFVSESIGRGIAKAEAEAEMEAMLELKNFEIARLSDRLHYYETMNKEMSQRNQEAIEIARCERQKRRRRQKWVWSSIGAAITLGSAALAWSYLPSGKASSSTNTLESPEPDSNVQ